MKFFIPLMIIGFIGGLQAFSIKHENLIIKKARILKPLIKGRPTSGYMHISEVKGEEASLIQAQAVELYSKEGKLLPVDKIRLELHTHRESDDKVEMIKVDSINVPPLGKIELKRRGGHLMIFNLPQEELARMVIKLTFKNREGRVTTQDVHFPIIATDETLPCCKEEKKSL